MTYWHMQFSPNDDWGREKELLEKMKLIGIAYHTDKFYEKFKDIEIGDIILLNKGRKALALVEVLGDLEELEGDDLLRLDWFKYRRKVKVLDWAKVYFTPPTLSSKLVKVTSKDTVYDYIDIWYRDVSEIRSDNYIINQVYIKDYKMFKNFKIDFKKQPLIVLVGKNGTGKTTLFEYLKNYKVNENDSILITKTEKERNSFYNNVNEPYSTSNKTFELTKRIKHPKLKPKKVRDLTKEFHDHLEYISIELNTTGSISEIIHDYISNRMNFFDERKSDIIESLNRFIKKIFRDIDDLGFYLSDIDIEKKIYWKNKNYSEFITNDLSTGEKTLLSKVLYLFISNINNKVILIDEPEISLHPSWQNKVLKIYENFAKEYNSQIIIATHSPHIIGSAKPECLRLLRFNEDNDVEVLDNISQSYGMEFNKILTEIMGVKETRTPDISKKIGKMWYLLEEEEYDTDEYKKVYSYLEETLGSLDQDLVLARLEVAKLKAQNA